MAAASARQKYVFCCQKSWADVNKIKNMNDCERRVSHTFFLVGDSAFVREMMLPLVACDFDGMSRQFFASSRQKRLGFYFTKAKVLSSEIVNEQSAEIQ